MAESRVTRRMVERRKRGIFGWFFLTIFWLFNALMAYTAYMSLSAVSEQGAKLATEAEVAGLAVGATIGFGMLLFFWVAGVIIFGALAYFTRGRVEMIEITDRG